MSQEEDNNTSLEIIQSNRTIKFWDTDCPLNEKTAIYDPVPADYDIFSLLNVQIPPNETPRNWTLVFANGSRWEPRIHQMYQVSCSFIVFPSQNSLSKSR